MTTSESTTRATSSTQSTQTDDASPARNSGSPVEGPAVVFHTMGTAVSFRAPTDVRDALTDGVRQIFHMHDERFSLHKPDSELSRVAAGTLMLSRSSQDLKDMYAVAVDWRNATDGLFDPCDPDGRLDLNGVVKAHALHQAGQYLHQQGACDWSLNCGGDILCSGHQSAETPWAVGISDPADRTSTISTITTSPERAAVATSGFSERGQHIWAPTGRHERARALVQVTVAAPDIITADVLATAICAGGHRSIPHLVERFDADILTVGPDRQPTWHRKHQPRSVMQTLTESAPLTSSPSPSAV